MKRLLLISMILGTLPMAVAAQIDDLYFVPKKTATTTVEKVTYTDGMPKNTYYVGSDRSVDEYNRRTLSHYEPIGNDSTVSDTISFSAEKGVYPTDSIVGEDFQLTKKMSRFEDYRIADNAAFWAGYQAGRYDWAWHSPWYYGRYGWYSGWYDPWYYYDPLFYGSWAFYGYYGYHTPWAYGWYDPYWYGPWYYGGYYDYHYPLYVGGGVRHHYAPTIGAGSIRRDGSTYSGYRRGASGVNSRHMSELRNRTVNGSSRNGRTNSTGSRTYSGNSRQSSYNNSGNYSSSRSSGGSFSSGGSRSSGGSFSGGGSHGGGGGGGSRMGGRR